MASGTAVGDILDAGFIGTPFGARPSKFIDDLTPGIPNIKSPAEGPPALPPRFTLDDVVKARSARAATRRGRDSLIIPPTAATTGLAIPR